MACERERMREQDKARSEKADDIEVVVTRPGEVGKALSSGRRACRSSPSKSPSDADSCPSALHARPLDDEDVRLLALVAHEECRRAGRRSRRGDVEARVRERHCHLQDGCVPAGRQRDAGQAEREQRCGD